MGAPVNVTRVFVGLALLGILTTWPMATSSNDASRMATIQSLVDFHTLTIEHSTFDTIDKVLIGGHFYSDKLIMPALIGAAAYGPLSLIGLKLDTGANLAYYLITLFTVKAFWLGGLIAFYRAVGLAGLDTARRMYLVLALGLGSLYFTWSSTFNNHSLAASFTSIGFFFILRSKFSTLVRKDLFWAGLFFGMAGSCDLPIMAIYGSFLLYALADSRLRHALPAYLLPLLLTLVPVLLINFHISGSLIPVQLNSTYFLYPGSFWSTEPGLTGVSVNRGAFLAEYTFNSLLGSRGFLLYNPLTLIAVPLMIREMVARRQFAQEARTVSLASLLVIAYYALFSSNYGGWSYSIRWFVPLLPLWLFFIAPFISGQSNPRRDRLLAMLFALSLVIAVIGLVNPWSNPTAGPPVVSNLRLIWDAVGGR